MLRREVEAEQRRERRVLLVPVEGPGLLAVALVPVPGLAVRLRRRRRRRRRRRAPRHPAPSLPPLSTDLGLRGREWRPLFSEPEPRGFSGVRVAMGVWPQEEEEEAVLKLDKDRGLGPAGPAC